MVTLVYVISVPKVSHLSSAGHSNEVAGLRALRYAALQTVKMMTPNMLWGKHLL